MANIVEQAIIELQSVYKGGGAKKAKKDLENLKRELKNANGSVQRLQNSLKQLNRVPLAFDDQRAMGRKGARGAAILEANKALKEYFSTIQTGRRQLAATEAGLKAQSAAFNRIAANAKKGGELYSAAVNSQVRAEQKLRLAQLERLKVEQDLFSKGRTTKNDAFKGVDELLSMGNKLPRTIGALSLYKSELEQTLRVVEIGSEKYKALEKAIEGTDQRMKGQQKKKGGLAGLAENLADAKEEQKGLTALSDKWFDATVRVKKAQFEYNKELFRSRIGTARINEDINGTVRALNLAKQAAKGGLGILGGVAGAVGGVGKKALGTRFGKIGAARGIDALAKKVPVVDKAFGRLLQKIPLLGKFLNENISVNARWSAQILEGITGVTLAWNGLNQIISAAQAFTTFERQAAIAINSVARRFKELYNVAGAMMMGFISPDQVARNAYQAINDRPDVMAARRGPSRLEQLEKDQANLKSKIRNAEVNEVQLIEGLNKKLLEVERSITEETRERILIRKKEQESLMRGPVWTQYSNAAGPGGKGAGLLSSMEGNLGETRIRLAEKVTAEGKEYESVAKSVVQQETRINAELQEREAIYKRLQQGASLTSRQQADARTSLAAQRETEGIGFRGRTVSRRGFQRYQRMRQGRRDRRQRLNENLMLGAGFPMLFGGGLGGIAGGIGGAVAQSKMGTKGGFGAQIILSAIGQKFDQIVAQMVASTAKLGKAMNKYSLNVGEVTKSLGVTGTATEAYIQELEKVKGPQAAMNEAMERLTGIVGEKGVNNLKQFGQASQGIQNMISIIVTKTTAGLAGILNLADKFFKISENANRITRSSFDEKYSDPTLRKLQLDLANVSGGKGAKQSETNRIKAEIELLRQAAFEKSQQGIEGDTANMSLEKEIENLKQRLKLGERNAAIEKEINEIIKERNLDPEKDKDIIERIKGNVAIKTQLEEQLALWTQIKDTIATGLTSAIEGLIAGTKTLGESLGSIAKSIGSMLLQSAISSYVGGINFGGGKRTTVGQVSGVTASQGMYMANGIKPFASGGLATRPTLGLVGEAGEDEYIIPASKMASSMQRYSAGARGEAVIPSTGSSYAGGGGSSTTVNYSGPILNFNSEEFVPKSAVGQIIATATARGAAVGESRTISSLRNSRSRRSSLGL